MKYKDDQQPLLKNGHGTRQPESQQHAAVPATLLPNVLSRLGLADMPVLGDEQALAALQDEKSHVRVAAVRSLGERKEVSSLQFLVSALHDPAWEVRVAVVWALRGFGEHAPVEALIEALTDEDGSVRAAALRVLAGMRGQVPPELLARMLHDADWLVHEAAELTVEELGEIEVLGERYQLQDPIGRGGMATIYRGQDMRMDRVVAIKVLREAYSTDPKFVQRFQREAKAASAMQHPNIVQVYDYGQSDGNYFIVMELVEGTDLRRYLHSRGVLDVDRAVIIAHDVALGLAAAHRRGIVHRDVKPQNVLVGRDGSIKLTDFGIASVYQDINARRLTTTGMTLGTVEYYAPEQAQGEIVSPAADVYALGIVMYEMLTGRTPFDGDTPVVVAMQHIQDPPVPPSQVNPSIPVALEEIILRCLEKVPEMRFHDGSSLARALETLGDAHLDEPALVRPGRAPLLTPSPSIPARPAQRDRGGSRAPGMPEAPAASLEHRMGPAIPSNQNAAEQVPALLVHQPVNAYQQSFAAPPGSAASSQFQLGIVPSSGGAPPAQRHSRFTKIMAIFIPLTILFLLGFSIYLAAELGFITLPFLANSPTPTATTALGTVPDLRGLDYQHALSKTTAAGFHLQASNNVTTGVVIGQSVHAGDRAVKGFTIFVQMGQVTATSTLTITVPPHLVGNTLAAAEEILQTATIPYKVQSTGFDPSKGPNIVTRVNPAQGSPLAPGQKVTLYVVNLTGTPTVIPSPTPTPTPGRSPSTTPNPDPTPFASDKRL